MTWTLATLATSVLDNLAQIFGLLLMAGLAVVLLLLWHNPRYRRSPGDSALRLPEDDDLQ